MTARFSLRDLCITGMISGVIGGCVCGMAVWLYLSSREEGGLAAEYFVKNTGKVILIIKPSYQTRVLSIISFNDTYQSLINIYL